MSDPTRTPVIVSAARTPIGKFLGGLSPLTAPELGAVAIRAAVQRAGIEPGAIEEVIMGNVIQGGVGQAPARQAAIKAGIPATVSALTINKVCGSGLKAVMLAAQAIKAGDRQVIVAGGQESMSNAPYYIYGMRGGVKLGDQTMVDGMIKDGLWCAFCDVHMGGHAEYTAKKAGVTREAQDEFAAAVAREGGRRDRGGEVQGRDRPGADRRQQGPDDRRHRRGPAQGHDASKSLAKLRPAFPSKDGSTADLTVTAGNASEPERWRRGARRDLRGVRQGARPARFSRASTRTRPARPSRRISSSRRFTPCENLMTKEQLEDRRLRSDRGERGVRVAGARRRSRARLGLGSRQRERRRDRARSSDRRERRARAHDAPLRAARIADAQRGLGHALSRRRRCGRPQRLTSELT